MKNKKFRNICITLFVIAWMALFHYESTRHFYLQKWLGKPLVKVKFLFPPAGWIMFFNIDEKSGNTEVYGIKNKQSQLIDSHDIFRTRTIGFDNIHRGIMGSVTREQNRQQFCRFLRRRFDYFDSFAIAYHYYPSVAQDHYKRHTKVLYQCVQ